MEIIHEEIYFEVPYGADGRHGFGQKDIIARFPFQDGHSAWHENLRTKINRLSKQRLRPATLGEVISIFYDSLVKNPENPMSQRVKQYISEQTEYFSEQTESEQTEESRTLSIFVNTGLLYTERGLFIQDNPKITINSDNEFVPAMKESELQKRLGKGDPTVRYIPNYLLDVNSEYYSVYQFSMKVSYGEQTPMDLERNLFVLELVGLNEAIKFAELSKEFGGNPEVGVPHISSDWKSVNNPRGRTVHPVPISYFVTLELMGKDDIGLYCGPYPSCEYGTKNSIGILPDDIAFGIKESEKRGTNDGDNYFWKEDVQEGRFKPYIIEPSRIVKKKISN